MYTTKFFNLTLRVQRFYKICCEDESVNYSWQLWPKKQKRESIDLVQITMQIPRLLLQHGWCENLKVAARSLEALHKHPSASNPTFLTNRSWSNSLIGSLHFHKYFSNPLRCFGGTVVASPLPLSLHQVLRKATFFRASNLCFFDAWRYPTMVASRVMKPLTTKRSCSAD